MDKCNICKYDRNKCIYALGHEKEKNIFCNRWEDIMNRTAIVNTLTNIVGQYNISDEERDSLVETIAIVSKHAILENPCYTGTMDCKLNCPGMKECSISNKSC